MKLQNYKAEDVSASMEERRKVLNQLEQIESNLWTDDVDSAIKRTVDLHLTLVNLSRMQSAKRLDSNFKQLHDHLNAQGINVHLIHDFRHKKAD